MKNLFSSKICFKCNKEKPIDNFYKHLAMADGYLGKCKDCAKADSTARRYSKLEQIREYERQKGRTDEHRNAARNYATSHPETIAAAKKRYADRYPEKTKARYIINNAIKSGKIASQACEICGDYNSEAHHNDYSRPLEVIWLCDFHHKEYHVVTRELERRSTPKNA